MAAAPSPTSTDTRPRLWQASPVRVILGRLLPAAALLTLTVWSIRGLGFDLTHLSAGVLSGRDYIARMFPHSRADWQYDRGLWPDLVKPLCETIQMATFGTALGALLAFPVSFIAARTGYAPRPISNGLKTLLNIARSVPTFIYAIVVVAAIGLGASAGAITIAFVSFISLAKLYAETLETVPVGPLEAVRAVGGNGAQVFVFGMLPQVFPVCLSTTLYTLEYNFKDAFIVGIVGAGGLGEALMEALRLYQLRDAGVVVAMMIVLVNLVDYLSYRVRLIFS